MPRYILLLTLLLHFSCTNKNVEDKSTTSATQDSTSPAQVTILANLPDSLQPETILLANTPAPKTVRIPDKPLSVTLPFNSGQRTTTVEPVAKRAASLSPSVQFYTSEQGLALDVTSYCYTDRSGNLWFGTWVGGASKYDGNSFTIYTTSNGLISNTIVCIAEDRAGNIWFGTDLGASKFDGTTFSTLGNFRYVTSILNDSSGNLWFACSDGLYKYAGDSITRYTERDGLSGNEVLILKEDRKKRLWIGTNNGLSMYDGKEFKTVLNNARIQAICIDQSGNIWAGIRDDGYVKYDGANITSYSFPSSSDPTIYEDHFSNIWLDGEMGGTWIYNNKLAPPLNQIHGLPIGAMAGGITEDKSGNIWFGTVASGVIKYSGPTFQQLTTKSMRGILEDKSGNIWTAGADVNKFDGVSETSFKLGNVSWGFFEDKSGTIWMGTDGQGLVKLKDNSFTFYTDLNGLAENNSFFITEDSKGFLWIGTLKGLSKFDGKSFTNFTKKQGLAGDIVSCILEDKSGEILIGTDGGLSIFDGKSFANYSISNSLQGNDIRSLIRDKQGNLWIGTYGGGLRRYDGKSFCTYTTTQGLPDNVVTQVALTKEENIVVGTNNGIALLTGFKSDSSSDSKSSSNLSTEKNFPAQNSLSNKELKNMTPVFEIYNPKSGYPVMDVNRGQYAIFNDSKGMLWIASGSEKSGVMRFDYAALYKNNRPPDLNILSLKIGNELICWNDLLDFENNSEKPISTFESITVPASVTEEVTTFGRALSDAQRAEMRNKYKGVEFDAISKFYPVPQNLILPYSHNGVTIEFAAIEPDKPSLVQYQYMLEGYDKNWSTPANITSATFGNMSEGTYHFHVKARSPAGIWSEPITYTFTVLAPWWRTWLAYSVYVLTFLFLLSIFIKWRERNLRMEKEKLENKVRLRTAEVVTEKKKSDDLLLNILPQEVAEELKTKGSTEAKQFAEVTVMFTDFKDFTQISEKLTPSELVAEIDTCYKTFDQIISKYNIEKIKTIGDSYMCAGGLPVANATHATDVVKAALEIQQFMRQRVQERKKASKEIFEIRIGIHTGPVVAGIVGIKKFAYDIWGDTVNIASRMESTGEAGKVNISGATYELVKEKFTCTHRGKIPAKNKGEVDMYFVEYSP